MMVNNAQNQWIIFYKQRWSVQRQSGEWISVLACVLAIYEAVLHMSTPYNCIVWSNFTYFCDISMSFTAKVTWAAATRREGAELTVSVRFVFRVWKIPPENTYISKKKIYSIVVEVQYII